MARQGLGPLQVFDAKPEEINDALRQVRDRFDEVERTGPWVVTTVTANYTATLADGVILADAKAAAFDVRLPSAAGRSGHEINVKRMNATNTVTVVPATGQTIDGAATYALSAQYAAVTLISDGDDWVIV